MRMEATSTDNRKGITVVIPNYNGIRFLGDCLEALGRQEEGTPPYSILVVDNGSEDGSLALLAECGDPQGQDPICDPAEQ